MQNYGYYHTHNTGSRPTTNPPPITTPLAMSVPNIPNSTQFSNPGPAQTKYMLQHQNPNSTVDPIYYQQQYHSSYPPNYYGKPMVPKLTKGLTSEEGEKLLQVWRQNNYADFNSWVQVAKAQVSIDISESSGDIHKGEKLYNCNLVLAFEEDKGHGLRAHGYGKSKKEAKKMAIEGIVGKLIQSGEIKRGLKNKDFLLASNSKQGLSFNNAEDSQFEQLQKKMHKMAKKMHECLKKDDFVGACELLYQISIKKKPDWNEISFIWCYALLKRNISYLKSIIDLIQYRKLLDEDLSPKDDPYETRNENEEYIKQELLKRYGCARLKSTNIYEYFDSFNVEANSPEINSIDTKEISEQEANAEIITFPLTRDLNHVLLSETDNSKMGPPVTQKPDDPNTPKDPYKFPPSPSTHLTHPPPAINIKPPPSINIQPPPPSLPTTKQPPPPQTSLSASSYGVSASNMNPTAPQYPTVAANDSNAWTMYHQPGWGKPEKPSEPGVQSSARLFHPEPPKPEYSVFPHPIGKPQAPSILGGQQPELGFTKELKNPEINYLNYKLLEEFYDSLLYVGDLNFATNTAEVLYTKVKLDDEEFLSDKACQYYSHKKNLLTLEFLEDMFQPINQNMHKIMECLVTLDGVVEKIGNKYAKEVLQFSPTEPFENIKTKVSKSKLTEWNDAYAQISEGEFIMLISLVQTLPEETDSLNEPQDRGYEFQQYTPQNYMQMSSNGNQYVIQKPPVKNLPQNRSRAAQEETNSTIEVAMIGCVKEISKDYGIKLYVLPTKEQSDTILQYGRTWKIVKLANQTPTEKTLEALEIFTTRISMLKPLTQILLLPQTYNPNILKQLADSNTQLPSKMHSGMNTNLNISQQKCLQAASTQLLTLIQGPPGTGKMITSIEIVLEWLRQSSLQVLVCAESSAKVDYIHNELEKMGVRSIKVASLHENEEILKAEKHSFNPLHNFRNDNIPKILRQAQVVCSTCIGCSSEYLEGMTFARILIMDANLLPETTCMIPLIKGCQQLVLVGDNRNLSPVVTSLWAQSKGMSLSLFERLVKQGAQPQFLNIQYKAHQSLVAFSSQHFYNNGLETGVVENLRPMVLGFNWPNMGVRVAFINVKGEEKIYNSSVQNTKEVEVVIEMLMHIMKSGYNQLRNIGILTLYEAQKNKLKNEVNIQAKKFPRIFGLTSEQAYLVNKSSNLVDIEVASSSAIEDKDLIIFSAVRSNTSGKLGLLRDPRKMNYAFSKARRGLIVIGNIEMLNQDKNWKEWIKWCRVNKVILHYA